MKGSGLLAFAFGAFVGAITAYGYFQSKYATDPKDKKPEQNQTPVSPMNPVNTSQKPAEPEMTDDGDEVVPDNDLPPNLVDLKVYSENMVDYTSFSQGGPEDKRKEDPGKKMSEERLNKPKMITYEEFGDHDTRETQTLLYFVDEGILTDESQDIIDDPSVLVGDTLDGFGQENYPVMFVRNYLLGIDYEVRKMAGTLL